MSNGGTETLLGLLLRSKVFHTSDENVEKLSLSVALRIHLGFLRPSQFIQLAKIPAFSMPTSFFSSD